MNNNNNDEIIPTLTLAKMYEKQEKYAKALQIYTKLFQKEQDEFIERKIAYLKDIIKDETKLTKNKMTQHLLSENERRLFQIDQKIPRKQAEPDMDKEQKSLENIFKQKKTFSELVDSRFSDMKVGNFFSSLASILGKKRRLQDVTLLEVLNAIDRI